MRGPPRPAALLTVPQMAKLAGTKERTMFRRLLRLHAKHGGDWLWRNGRRWMVNITRLNAAHPALFEKRYVEREEVEDLESRVYQLEKTTVAIKQGQNALASRVRAISKAR